MTADQTRWKINALSKKYKECIDNNSKSGRSPMTFTYFNEMQDMFGHRKNIDCDHVISSSLLGSKRQSSSFVESDQQTSSSIIKQASLSTSESLSTKILKIDSQQKSLNKASSETSSSEKRKKIIQDLQQMLLRQN